MIPTWGTSSGRNGAGGIPSLLLDFSNQSYLLNGTGYAAFGGSPDITFSRGTNATLIDSTGTLTYAPSNQFLNSESFAAATWFPTGLATIPVISNTIAAPDGTITADKIVENAVNTAHYTGQTTAYNASVSYTASIYAKAAERQYVQIILTTAAFGATKTAGFDLSGNGATVTTAGTTSSITSVGNGWYRCSITATTTAAASAGTQIRIADSLSATSASYLGDGTSGLYIWGAQLGAVTYETEPRPYNSTTPKNLLGYTEEFNNAAWVKPLATVTANSIADPNGNLNADTISATVGGGTVLQTLTLLAIPYTFSIWLKRKTGTGAVSITVDGVTYSTPTITTDWARYSTTLTPAAGSKTIGVKLATLGDEVYAWGAQLSDSASLDPYVYNPAAALTSTAYYGPRFDYDPNFINYSEGNIVKFPENFENSNWTKGATIVTQDQSVSPAYTLTADKVAATSVNAEHYVRQTLAITTGSTVVASVYVKASGYTAFRIRCLNSAIPANGFLGSVDTATGLTAGSGAGIGTLTSVSATDVGDGWFLLTVIGNAGPTAASLIFDIFILSGNQSSGTIFTGNDVNGGFFWGAQVVIGSTYIPYYYYTNPPLGLLIEEARTNLLLQSEQFDIAATWSSSNVDVTANTIASPSGTTNADAIIERTTPTVFHYINQSVTKSASSIQYAASFYVKNKGREIILNIQSSGSNGVVARFNPATGSITSGLNAFGTGWTAGSLTITSAGNGWYKVVAVATSDTATTVQFQCSFYNTALATNVYQGDGVSGVYLWGAQMEAGAFATSYIPTAGASVTRSADVATMVGNNFTNWYNQTAGTLTVEFDASANGSATYVSASNGTITQNSVHIDNNTGIMRAVYYSGSALVAALGLGAIGTVNATNKIATAYAVNDFAASRNGGTVATDTLGAVPVSLTQLNIGADDRLLAANYTSNHIKSISYFNSRLPDASLQAITA